MLIPAFKLQLNNPILKGLVDVGKYDGEHPSLTCATTAGKIFFHTPHDKSGQNEVKFLNINRKISALKCGRLATKHQREVGAGYFDRIATTVDPTSSTTALAGSTEEGQFH